MTGRATVEQIERDKAAARTREEVVAAARARLVDRLRKELAGEKLGPDPVKPSERLAWESAPVIKRLCTELEASDKPNGRAVCRRKRAGHPLERSGESTPSHDRAFGASPA